MWQNICNYNVILPIYYNVAEYLHSASNVVLCVGILATVIYSALNSWITASFCESQWHTLYFSLLHYHIINFTHWPNFQASLRLRAGAVSNDLRTTPAALARQWFFSRTEKVPRFGGRRCVAVWPCVCLSVFLSVRFYLSLLFKCVINISHLL